MEKSKNLLFRLSKLEEQVSTLRFSSFNLFSRKSFYFLRSENPYNRAALSDLSE